MKPIAMAMILCGAFSLPAAPTVTLRITSVFGCVQGTDRALIGVPISSFSLGGEFPVNAATGAGAGHVSIGDLRIVKALDDCSVRLFKVFALGQHIQTAEVRVYDTNKAEVIRLVLSEIFVSAIDYTPGQEVVSLSAGRFEFTHVPTSIRSCFDVRTMSSC